MTTRGSRRQGAGWAGIAAVALLGATACATLVVIPMAAQDHPPVINVSNYVVGASAQIDKPQVSSTGGTNQVATVTPSGTKCEIPRLTIIGSAKNPGGVKEITLKVFQGTNPSAKYTVTASATASGGKGPDLLSIPAWDGHGAVGDKPLEIRFDGGKAGCPLDNTFRVSVSATNFNGQTTQLDEEIHSNLAGQPSTTGCICE